MYIIIQDSDRIKDYIYIYIYSYRNICPYVSTASMRVYIDLDLNYYIMSFYEKTLFSDVPLSNLTTKSPAHAQCTCQ